MKNIKNIKLEIRNYNYDYHIELFNLAFADHDVAKHLKLTEEEYQDILSSHGAYIPDKCYNYYFRDQEHAKKALDYLEALVIMNKLLE